MWSVVRQDAWSLCGIRAKRNMLKRLRRNGSYRVTSTMGHVTLTTVRGKAISGSGVKGLGTRGEAARAYTRGPGLV